jgi:cytochrome oxidase assembly protein ShyY1
MALVLLAVTVVGTIELGRWQLSRAQEKLDMLAAVAAGRRQPPLQLTPADSPAQLTPWRPTVASGQWLADRTVLLDNRSAGGRPGFWVVTPLLLTGTVSRGTAVAVLRGWLPRQSPDVPLRGVPAASGTVSVQGELLDHVPRLMELAKTDLPASLPDASGIVPRVQNLDLEAYAKTLGLSLMPVVLQQTGKPADGLVRDWPAPPSNIDMHRGYALQWFSFAAIAAIAFGVLLVRHFRSTR